MSLLSVFGVGATILAPRNVAPALTGEVEQVICKVGALLGGGDCPDHDPSSSQMAMIETGTRIIPETGDDEAKSKAPKCMSWIRDPYLTTNAAGTKVVVAEAWIQCDNSVDGLKVEAGLYYQFAGGGHVGLGNTAPNIWQRNGKFASARLERVCRSSHPREYVGQAKFEVDFAPGVGGWDEQHTPAVTLNCAV